MASLRKQGNIFYACITLKNGKRTQRPTGIRDQGSPRERAEAKRKAQLIADQMEEAVRGNKTEGKIRKMVSDLMIHVNGKRLESLRTDTYLKNWLASVKIQKATGTFARYDRVIQEFLHFLGERSNELISEVTREDVQAFVNEGLADGKKPKTIETELNCLSGPFSLAMAEFHLLTNPTANVQVPAVESESKQPFTLPQVKSIFLVANGDWRTAVMFGYHTGIRLSDCANLTWANIDLEAKLLRFRPSKTTRHKKSVMCPMHPTLYAHLLTVPSSDRAEAPIMPTLAGRYTGGRSGLSAKFDALLAEANIDNPFVTKGEGKGRRFRSLGFHSWRRTFKTLLVDAGVAVETVDVMTGHAKNSVSERYIHRDAGLLLQAVMKLPNISAEDFR